MNLFPPLTPEIGGILDSVPALIEKTFPLPGRHRAGLPADVAELSRLLTSGRGERSASYLGRPNLLSAYLRCFFPWNLYRLCRLLPALALRLEAGDAVTDLGAGPLTFAAALWIARPDLRELPLEFRCLDQTSAILEAGLKFFDVLSGKDKNNASCPWKIKTIRGSIDGMRIYGKPAKLVSAVNVFNELIQGIPHAVSLTEAAKKRVRFLSPLLDREGSVLVVEPGVPRSGEFIAALRTAFLEAGRYPLAPCVHSAACPLPGNRRQSTSPGHGEIDASLRKSSHAMSKWCHVTPKWCHFAFATDDAPAALRKLSAAAGLPKDRATLSFLFAGTLRDRAAGAGVDSGGQNISDGKRCRLRILSDSFPAGPSRGRYAQAAESSLDAAQRLQILSTSLRSPTEGRYACGEQGLVLVKGPAVGALEPGGLLLCDAPFDPERDPRSGALVYAGIVRKFQFSEQ
ncbi:MAG: rRNA methyltransferase [Treponema sp.]|nr:rRNA methyltransferase [Treponema sp.]